MKQVNLNLFKGKHGGRRPNSGRKRLHSLGVAHRTREKITSRTPVHINFKVNTPVKNKECLKHLKRAIYKARKLGLKVIHFSLQSNHVHLIGEAADNETLSRGMRSLTISFAKAIGKGRIQLERYHLHVLRSLRETKNALHYVLFNEQKHKKKFSQVDEYSSLLTLPNALDLIKEYVGRFKMTIIVKKSEEFDFLSLPGSYFLRQSLRGSS